jgi:hypothetical protein
MHSSHIPTVPDSQPATAEHMVSGRHQLCAMHLASQYMTSAAVRPSCCTSSPDMQHHSALAQTLLDLSQGGFCPPDPLEFHALARTQITFILSGLKSAGWRRRRAYAGAKSTCPAPAAAITVAPSSILSAPDWRGSAEKSLKPASPDGGRSSMPCQARPVPKSRPTTLAQLPTNMDGTLLYNSPLSTCVAR